MEKLVNISQFDNESLEIVKKNAEDILDDIASASEIIDAKANTYFSVLLLVVVSCIGYLVNQIDKSTLSLSNLITHEITILLTMSLLAMIQIHRMLLPTDYRLKGTKPEFHIDFDGYEEQDRKHKILEDTIATLQLSIDHNISVHQKRVEKLKNGIDYIVTGIFATVSYGVIFIIITFLFSRS